MVNFDVLLTNNVRRYDLFHMEMPIFFFVKNCVLGKIDLAFHHGTIIQTGKTCKKILSYMRISGCRWHIIENVKTGYVKNV